MLLCVSLVPGQWVLQRTGAVKVMLPVCIMLHMFIRSDLCTTALPIFTPMFPVAEIDLLLLLYS